MRFRKSDGSERALSVVVDEARRIPAPRLDWSSLEAKLAKAVELPPPAAVIRRPSRVALALLPAAAALALLANWALPRALPSATPVAAAPHVAGPLRNGDALSAEELIAAELAPVQVVHEGRARWTLEPNSRALVLEHGDVVRVRLLAGALKADVVPTPKPEGFVVEAAGTRIAVHGTVFRVQLRGEQTLVDVEQGVVAVGPRERPTVSTALLRAPAHGEFTLEGTALSRENSTRKASRRLVVAHPNRQPNGAASSEPVAPEAAPDAGVLHPLTIGEAEAGVEIVVRAVSRCFNEHTEGSHDVRVRANTELTLDVSAEGVVTGVNFTPPLSPLVQNCGTREALTVRFAPSLEGAKLTRALDLYR